MIEIAHHSALIPLLVLLIWRRDAPAAYWLIALGFSVSWFADSFAWMLDGSWIVGHYYRAVQLGLFALALGSLKLPTALLVLTALPMGLERPEIVLTALGSVAVVYLARKSPWAPMLIVYCGIGTLFYLGFSSEIGNYDRFMMYWYPYQVARLVAFALFVRQAVLLTRDQAVA